MPAAEPPEFRRRAVELARQGDVPIAQLAKDLGIAESGLRRWMKQADLDEGRRSDGLTGDERRELAELRRLSDAAHQSGLTIALAGGLRRAHFPELVDVCPDILGVRGAACAGGRRTAPVSARAVRALKRDLLASFAAERDAVNGA